MPQAAQLAIQLLALALQAAPSEIALVEQAISDHWGKDHVQQLVKGVSYLQQMVTAIAGIAEAKITPVMPTTATTQVPPVA